METGNIREQEERLLEKFLEVFGRDPSLNELKMFKLSQEGELTTELERIAIHRYRTG